MGANAPVSDHYAALQVHPDAEQEVIDAAFRQLMKKYHPDVAGDDPNATALHHQRATVINRAYSVLRDPELRREYDRARVVVGVRPPPAPPRQPRPTASAQPETAGGSPSPAQAGADVRTRDWSMEVAGGGPLAMLSAAYYLLPGPYEWEAGRKQELLTILVLPPLGIVSFALATGRFATLIGNSMSGSLIAWGVILLALFPVWRALPRVALAVLPSGLLLTGLIEQPLLQAHLPGWLAWTLLGTLSLIFSARIYVFSVLPTLGMCWLLARFG